MIRKYIVTGLMSLALGALSAAPMPEYNSALEYCHGKVKKSLSELGKNGYDYTMMPRNIAPDGKEWNCRKATCDEWCAGFWPGVLWYDYESTQDPEILKQAENYTASLEYLSRTPAFDHDLGFLVFCSYGNAYRLTHDKKYKEVILNTADTLATLFNPKVGTILSWPRNVEMLGGHNTIMDNMINLEMLFWASKNGGPRNLYDIAVKHAETTMKNHFRPDYTSYHVAVYDPDNGKFIKGMTHQGYADDTMWARGQSWAIYGYTMVYRETGDPRFLDFAKKVTNVYLDRLPADYVPYWDFDDPKIPAASRDASAAAVVASALLELQCYCEGAEKARYLDAAYRMINSLNADRYRSPSTRSSFLDHSTGHRPAGSEIDYSIIYADYYYIEALNRLKELERRGTLARLVSGRIYPERADDIAFENELVGFRIYGPGTQAKGEKAYGYDIFLKHPTQRQILEDLYRPETSPSTWAKVDSLRKINPKLAEDYISSFSYHIDHGLGMDCYAVGPTLGAGAAAVLDDGLIQFPWCYKEAEVMENGPTRFAVRLDFSPVQICGRQVTEHRIITLEAGSQLAHCEVWYEGLDKTVTAVAGFPRRDDSKAIYNARKGFVGYADPTQGKDNGKAMLGLVLNNKVKKIAEDQGHILAYTTLKPGQKLDYYYGFAWDRAGDIKDMSEWEAYLDKFSNAHRGK